MGNCFGDDLIEIPDISNLREIYSCYWKKEFTISLEDDALWKSKDLFDSLYSLTRIVAQIEILYQDIQNTEKLYRRMKQDLYLDYIKVFQTLVSNIENQGHKDNVVRLLYGDYE